MKLKRGLSEVGIDKQIFVPIMPIPLLEGQRAAGELDRLKVVG